MTSTEFKTRLENGDKLAVVMEALWQVNWKGRWAAPPLGMESKYRIQRYSEHAAWILAALASAEARKK